MHIMKILCKSLLEAAELETNIQNCVIALEDGVILEFKTTVISTDDLFAIMSDDGELGPDPNPSKITIITRGKVMIQCVNKGESSEHWVWTKAKK